MLLLLLLQILLTIQPIDSHITARQLPVPHCFHARPRAPGLPKITDCLHVIRDLRSQAAESRDRYFTVSRRISSNMRVPNTWWDHVPHSTCAIHLDMIDSRPDASDEARIIDILRTAEWLIEECLTPRANEGWDGSEGVRTFFVPLIARCAFEPQYLSPLSTNYLALQLRLNK